MAYYLVPQRNNYQSVPAQLRKSTKTVFCANLSMLTLNTPRTVSKDPSRFSDPLTYLKTLGSSPSLDFLLSLYHLIPYLSSF